MRKLILLAALALPVLIVLTLPASVAIRAAGLEQLPLRGVTGTPWRGSAQWLHPGRPASGLHWHWRFPWHWQWHLDGDGINLAGDLHPGRSALRLAPVDGNLAVARLDLAQWLPFTQPHGDLELDLQHVTLTGGWIEAVDGTARWRQARLSGAIEEDLGAIALIFSSENGVVRADLRSAAPAAVELRGQVRVQRDTYEADLWLRAAPGRPDLAQQLARMGEVQPDGQVRVRHQGRLLLPGEAP